MPASPLSAFPFRQRLMWALINFYPPLLGAGIRVRLAPDGATLTARLALNGLNRNLFGTQFGGSLYAMCDPWYVILAMQHLGPDYIIWDKAARIDFLRPGRGPVQAVFHIPPATLDALRARADAGEKVEPVFEVTVTDDQGQSVARVQKTLYIRRKQPQRAP